MDKKNKRIASAVDDDTYHAIAELADRFGWSRSQAVALLLRRALVERPQLGQLLAEPFKEGPPQPEVAV